MSYNKNKTLIKLLKVGLLYELYEEYEKENEKKRKFWVHESLLLRNKTGFFVTVYPKMKKDPEKFFKYTRMTLSLFNILLNLLKERLKKLSIRTPICPEFRLLLTIMYLAHGGPRSLYESKFKIGRSSFTNIIYETCCAIWEELSSSYISTPNVNDFEDIAAQYYEQLKLPNCIGAIDGKHIEIVRPSNKGRSSLILWAVCDADSIFTIVDVSRSACDKKSDGAFQNSEFGKILLNNSLQLPADKELPNTNVKCSHYFVADTTFPMKRHMMRPYPGLKLSEDKEYFNRLLSNARETIENSFGILLTRWCILKLGIHASPENSTKIIKAVAVLHNYLMLHSDQYKNINWRNEAKPLTSVKLQRSNRSTCEAFSIRDIVCNFVNANRM